MGSSADGCRELAAYLTGTEARELATRLAAGQTLSTALGVVGPARRPRVRSLLVAAGMGQDQRDLTVSVLRAVEGAHGQRTSISTVWTTPGGLAQASQLTGMLHRYVDAARESVICSTYNFQRSSALWRTLQEVSSRTEVAVRIYVDTAAADHNPAPWKPTTSEVAATMAGARVFRTQPYAGGLVTNHAKFIAIDHQVLIVTSANFSQSAEQKNVELGLVLVDPILTQQVERVVTSLDDIVYERVR